MHTMTEINTEINTEITPFEERLSGSYALVMPEGLTFYWQAIPSTEATSEVIQEHLQNGWEPMAAKDARIIVLQSMFASVHGLAENDESISLWSLTQNVANATEVPVALASYLDRIAIEERAQQTNHDIPIYVRTVNPLPMPIWGTVGVVWHDEINITTIRLEALPPEAQTLQQNISDLIKETVEDADWWLSDTEPTPDMIAALHAMNERIRADLAGYDERTKALAEGGRVLAKMYHDYYVTKILPQRTPAKQKQQLPAIADVFHSERGIDMPSHQGMQALLGFIYATSTIKDKSDMGRLTMIKIKDSTIPNYRHITAATVSDVQYRDTLTENLLPVLKKMSTGIDSDVLLCFIAQFLTNTKELGNTTWITAESILSARGLKKIRGGHGYRQEQYDEVEAAVNRIENLWITIVQQLFDEPTIRKGKKKKTRQRIEDRVIIIKQRLKHDELISMYEITSSRAVAWRFELGEWQQLYLTGANRQIGYMALQIIRYDPHNEAWEKRLGQYLFFHLRMNHQHVVRTIGNLITELGLSVDNRNPEKTKTRFEKAMNTLQADGIISLWEYQETTELLARHWLQTWLERKVSVSG